MNNAVFIVNCIFVSFYGCMLSAAFCGLPRHGKARYAALATAVFVLALQGAGYCLFGAQVIRCSYPLTTHLPIFLLLWYITRRCMCSATAVLTAYLCCQLRRWAALFAVWLLGGGESLQPLMEALLTLPLLALLLHFAAPRICRILSRPAKETWPFAVLPALYYCFDYAAVVYTDLLYSGNPLAVEFMPFVCCVVYLFFMHRISENERARCQLELERNLLDMQAKRSLLEIEALRRSQAQAAAYRHDLRHHLQYLAGCMENGQLEQGQAYIRGICEEIAAQKLTPYCENETVNLVLSAYAERAAKAGIPLKVRFQAGRFPLVSASDLCALLSNALENALHECTFLQAQHRAAEISVTGYEKGDKLAIQVSNSCREGIASCDGLPVSSRPSHGIGTRSIRDIVARYQGVCSFSVKDNMFLLRISV
jgi:hypothetical protein